MIRRTARLLITTQCPRACAGCCNQYPTLMASAQVIRSLEELRPYSEICITGGEPLLRVARTQRILESLRQQDSSRPLFLYTAWYTPKLARLLPLLTGVHYSVHAPANQMDIDWLDALQVLASLWPTVTWRLYVDRRVALPIAIMPTLWTRVEIKAWLPEGQCPLPAHEELLILDSPDWPEE